MVDNSSLGCRGADILAQGLSFAGEFPEGLLDLFDGRCGLLGKLDRDAGEVAVDDGDTVAVCRDLERVRSVVVETLLVLIDAPQDLGSLPFDLFLLASNVRDDVVQDVQRRDSRVSSTRDGLHRGAHDGLQGSEPILQGFQSDDNSSGRAIGVADDVTLLQTEAGTLVLDDGKVRRVDERNDKRDDGISSVVFGV